MAATCTARGHCLFRRWAFLTGLFLLYLLALLATSAAGRLGIYLAKVCPPLPENRPQYLFLFYLIGLEGTSFFPHPPLPLNLHYQVVFFALVALLFLGNAH